MLEWLTNCSIEDSLFYNYSYFSPYLKHTVSMHVNIIRQNYILLKPYIKETKCAV